jgi:hypothetical protein
MRKLVLSLAAVAAMLTLSAPTAGAATVGSSGLLAALQDMSIVDQVHCVPGWPHHVPTDWRRRDGCARGRVGPGIVGPGIIAPGVVIVPGRRWCHRAFSSRNFRC